MGSFDLASFSFHVPMFALLAKHNASPARQTANVIAMFLIFNVASLCKTSFLGRNQSARILVPAVALRN